VKVLGDDSSYLSSLKVSIKSNNCLHPSRSRETCNVNFLLQGVISFSAFPPTALHICYTCRSQINVNFMTTTYDDVKFKYEIKLSANANKTLC
jgi:hypothetical protein